MTVPLRKDPALTERPLNREDVNVELTKLLQHGHGELLVKVHAHRIVVLDISNRYLRRACPATGDAPAEEA